MFFKITLKPFVVNQEKRVFKSVKSLIIRDFPDKISDIFLINAG